MPRLNGRKQVKSESKKPGRVNIQSDSATTYTADMKLSRIDAVLGADLHLREDCPACRTDGPEGYWKEQEAAIWSIRELCEKHSCPFMVAGDIFHHWKPSPFLLAWALRELPPMIFVPGQHDLPQHNLELFDKSGCAVLQWGRVEMRRAMHVDIDGTDTAVPILLERDGASQASVTVLGAGWGDGVPEIGKRTPPIVLLTHRLVWQGKPPFPGAPAEGKASRLLRKFPSYDLILTGDNHEPFVIGEGGGTKYQTPPNDPALYRYERLLVNPGSMMRMTAAQVDHRPRVYLWNAETNEVVPHYLPITEGVISRTHIDTKEERDERIEAFVAKLSSDDKTDLDFEENLRRSIIKAKPNKRTEELIWQALETN